jgi:hypothetical protein
MRIYIRTRIRIHVYVYKLIMIMIICMIYIYILYMSIRAISRIDVSFKERELQGNDHDLRMPKFIGRGA